MAQRTANDVAEMESECIILRTDNERLRGELLITTTERDALKVELALSQAKGQEELIRAVQMETIMSQVSMGLIAGLKKMQDERSVGLSRIEPDRKPPRQQPEKAVQREAPREAAFDGRPAPRDLDAPQRPRQPSLRSEQGLSEKPPAFLRNPMPDTTRRPQDLRDIIDSRLPQVDIGLLSDDERDLAAQAELIMRGSSNG